MSKKTSCLVERRPKIRGVDNAPFSPRHRHGGMWPPLPHSPPPLPHSPPPTSSNILLGLLAKPPWILLQFPLEKELPSPGIEPWTSGPKAWM